MQCIPILMGIWRSRHVEQKMIWEWQIMHIPLKTSVLRYLRCSVAMCTVNIRDRCCKMEIGSHKFGISWLYLGVPCVVVWCRLNLIGKGTLDQIGDFQLLAYVLLGNTCVCTRVIVYIASPTWKIRFTMPMTFLFLRSLLVQSVPLSIFR